MSFRTRLTLAVAVAVAAAVGLAAAGAYFAAQGELYSQARVTAERARCCDISFPLRAETKDGHERRAQRSSPLANAPLRSA